MIKYLLSIIMPPMGPRGLRRPEADFWGVWGAEPPSQSGGGPGGRSPSRGHAHASQQPSLSYICKERPRNRSGLGIKNTSEFGQNQEIWSESDPYGSVRAHIQPESIPQRLGSLWDASRALKPTGKFKNIGFRGLGEIHPIP